MPCSGARSATRPTLLGLPASTVHRILARHGLDWLDRPTGEIVRRYEHERPGELVAHRRA